MISSGSGWARGFGFIALIFACVNLFGGFLVTQRMLAMYKKKGEVNGVHLVVTKANGDLR